MNFPQPTSLKYINDYVGLINKDVVEKIISIGKELEEKTTSELTVVIINTTEQLSVEEYANELFRKWGIGQKGKDNGVLLLVAIKDRVMRIEVGYGLEGAITDGEAGRIRDECILPYFEKEDYSKGVYYGYIALAKEIEKEYNTKLKSFSDEEFEQEKKLELPEKIQLIVGPIIILVFLVFFIWAMIIAFDRIRKFVLYKLMHKPPRSTFKRLGKRKLGVVLKKMYIYSATAKDIISGNKLFTESDSDSNNSFGGGDSGGGGASGRW